MVGWVGLGGGLTAEQRPEGSDGHWLDLSGKEEHPMLRDHHMQKALFSELTLHWGPCFLISVSYPFRGANRT